jgi:hypothetical protein
VGEIGVANPFHEVGSDDFFAVPFERLAVEIGKDFERVVIALIEVHFDVGAFEGHHATLRRVVRHAESLENTTPPDLLGDAFGLQGFQDVVQSLNIQNTRVVDASARELPQPFELHSPARKFCDVSVGKPGGYCSLKEDLGGFQ